MAVRNYLNGAPLLSLSVDVNASDVTLEVTSTAGYPTAPFILALERGTVNEEVVLCTAKTATTFTVTRGWDGTTGKSHSATAVIEHTTSSIDYNEANAHINGTGDVHSQYPLKTAWTGKGVLLTASAAGTISVLAAPTNDLVLVGDTAQAGGMKWSTLGSNSYANGSIALAKLDSSLQQSVIQRLSSLPGSPVAGQEVYNTTAGRWYGYDGSWHLRPHGIGKVTRTTGNPSGGADGDVHFKYTA